MHASVSSADFYRHAFRVSKSLDSDRAQQFEPTKVDTSREIEWIMYNAIYSIFKQPFKGKTLLG